jgi:hypothetical protein
MLHVKPDHHDLITQRCGPTRPGDFQVAQSCNNKSQGN